jgi:hypothetical protein
VFRRITTAPGAGTGQHCHDGQLVAVVEQDELTHYALVYAGGVHVYATGTADLVLLVTYVIAEGPAARADGRHEVRTSRNDVATISSPISVHHPH